jgi:hypothetical protein
LIKGPVFKAGFKKGPVYRPKSSTQLIEVPVSSVTLEPSFQSSGPTSALEESILKSSEGSLAKEGSSLELQEAKALNAVDVVHYQKKAVEKRGVF